MTVYRFRIAAANDAGQGHYSEIYEFSTCIAPPPSLKGILLFDHFVMNLKCINTTSEFSLETNAGQFALLNTVLLLVEKDKSVKCAGSLSEFWKQMQYFMHV
jgi:hypothetical protein